MPAKAKPKKPMASVPVKKELTQEEIEAAVEEYFGIHPKYFIYEGGQTIKVNIFQAQHEGVNFAGLKPSLTYQLLKK